MHDPPSLFQFLSYDLKPLKLANLTQPKSHFIHQVALLWFKQALSIPKDQTHQTQDVASLPQVNQFLE